MKRRPGVRPIRKPVAHDAHQVSGAGAAYGGEYGRFVGAGRVGAVGSPDKRAPFFLATAQCGGSCHHWSTVFKRERAGILD